MHEYKDGTIVEAKCSVKKLTENFMGREHSFWFKKREKNLLAKGLSRSIGVKKNFLDLEKKETTEIYRKRIERWYN